jgi:DNA primase
VYHPNGAVSKLCTDLLTVKHEESKIWEKGGGFTEKAEDILDLLIPKIIYEYKLRKIRLLMAEIEAEINKASDEKDFDRVIEEQSKYMNLKKVERVLSDKLGNRAFI